MYAGVRWSLYPFINLNKLKPLVDVGGRLQPTVRQTPPPPAYQGRIFMFRRVWFIITAIVVFAALQCAQAQAQTFSVAG